VKALVTAARACGSPLQVLESVEAANDRQKTRLFAKLKEALGEQLEGLRIAVWGLSFKPQTDDMRESPSLTLIDLLLAAGAKVVAHDPVAVEEARRRLGARVEFADTSYAATEDADALVVVTDWNEYRHPDLARVKSTMKRPVVIDGRNLYDPAKMRSLGFTYHSIGRAST
jgi:UDPglucose 6-dehydrogenase